MVQHNRRESERSVLGKEIIYSKFFGEIIKNNESIKIDYDTKKINNIYKPTFLEINNLLNINKTIKGIYFFKKLKIALKSLKTKKNTSLKKI